MKEYGAKLTLKDNMSGALKKAVKAQQDMVRQIKVTQKSVQQFAQSNKTIVTVRDNLKTLGKTVTAPLITIKDKASPIVSKVGTKLGAFGRKVTSPLVTIKDKISTPLKMIGGKLKSIGKMAVKPVVAVKDLASKGLHKMGAALSTIGKIGSTAFSAIGVASVKMAADFESGMSRVKAISGATEEQMVELTKKAKEMGATTKFSAKEATEAYQYMGMAGWKSGQMIKGIEPIMKLAGASGEDLATTSDIVTDALTAFGLKAKDTKMFTDVMAAASSNSNTNVAMLGESFKYAAPVAGALGFSVKDASLALGLMANQGIKASSAGTALRSMFTNLAKPTKSSQKAMDALGISLTDSKGKMKPLDTVIRDLRKSFNGLSEDQKAQYAASLAGKTGMSGLLAIVNSTERDFDKLSEAINNSNDACNDMYNTANDNLSGQFTILKSTVEGLGIAFGEKLTPFVKKGVERLQGFANKVKDVLDPATDIGKRFQAVGETIGNTAKHIFDTAKTILKPFTSLGGSMPGIGSIVEKVCSKITTAVDTLAPAIAPVIQGVVDAFPAIVGAISEVRAMFLPILAEIIKSVGEMLPTIVDAVKGVSGAIIPIVQSILPVIKQVLPPIVQVVKSVVPVVVGIVQKAAPLITKLVSMISSVLQKVLPTISRVIQTTVKAIEPVINTIFSLLETVMPIIGTLVEGIGDIINTVVPTIGSVIQAVIPPIQTALEALKPVIETIGAVFQKVMPVIQKVVESVAKVFETCAPVISGVFQTVSDVLSPILETISDALQGFFDFCSPLFDLIGGILDVLADAFEVAFDAIQTVVEAVWSVIEPIFEAIKAGVEAVGEAIDWLVDQVSVMDDFSQKVSTAIAQDPEMAAKVKADPSASQAAHNLGVPGYAYGENRVPYDQYPALLHQGERVLTRNQADQLDRKESGGGGGVSVTNGGTFNLAKLADTIVIREDADIDKIANAMVKRFEKVAVNMA